MDQVAPSGTWVPVSPALARARRIDLVLAYLVVLAVVVALFLLPWVPRWVAVVAVVGFAAGFGWAWWLIGRRMHSWGYELRPDDLLVARGIMFRRLVIVPYGRMQLVDVVAGPVERWCGIATVQLHTAAATTDAAIPGLVPQVAAELRDTLARLGEQRTAGL